MNVYKCDRCGRYFDKFVRKKYQITTDITSLRAARQLCEKCTDELEEWFENKRRAEDDKQRSVENNADGC